ncbi:MAG: glycerophosphodiester phosphodiesterase [Calditrichaceae bacterium]
MNPLIISHRGNGNTYPENTIPAMETALKQGANGLELDVRLCGDHELVVFHDYSLKRLFGSPDRVSGTNLERLQAMRFTNQVESSAVKIPKLSEVLEHFKDTVPINIEAKSGFLANREFVHHLSKVIEKSGTAEQIWISSFNPFLLRSLKSRNDKIKTGFLFKRLFLFHRVIRNLNGIDTIHPFHSLIDENLMSEARKRDLPVYAWTVNNLQDLSRIDRFDQVKGIITDEPKLTSEYYMKKDGLF